MAPQRREVPRAEVVRVPGYVDTLTEAEKKVLEQRYAVKPPTVRIISIPWPVIHAVTPMARVIAWASFESMRVPYEQIRERTGEIARRIYDELKGCLKTGEFKPLEDIVADVARQYNVDYDKLVNVLRRRWPRILSKLHEAEAVWSSLFK